MNERSMIVDVARAIYEKRNGAGCKPWSRLPQAHRDPYMTDARAAITAMREPTPAMLEAAAEIDGLAILPEWCSAIDAALQTPSGKEE